MQFSVDLDVAMHDLHERAEYRIPAAIGGAGIGNQMVAVVHVSDGGASGLVRPIAVAPLAVPVEVHTRPNHKSHQMPFLGTFVVRARNRNQIIGHGCRTN